MQIKRGFISAINNKTIEICCYNFWIFFKGYYINIIIIINFQESLSKALPFVLCLGDQPIGGIVIEQEDNINQIRTGFNIEKFIEFKRIERPEHSKILRCSIAPGFLTLTRFLLSETMRLSKSLVLYQERGHVVYFLGMKYIWWSV